MEKTYKTILGTLILALAVFAFTSFCHAQKYTGKKILFINSYHEGYAWSDGIVKGLKQGLKDSGIELKVVNMDTKRNGSEEFKKEAGLKVKAEIEAFKPDLVVAADDNAAAYVIVPYFKDSQLPFVFCGINWDASPYGFPSKTVTGILEVEEITGLAKLLRQFAKGDRIGFIADDSETNRKEVEYFKKFYNIETIPYFAKDFEDFKKGYVELQGKVDSLIFYGWAAIKDWKNDEAADFILKNSKVPSGTFQEEVMPFVMIGYLKIPEEQGMFSAEAALKILSGTKPLDIPVASNKTGKVQLNAKIAEKVGIQFPYELVQSAALIIE